MSPTESGKKPSEAERHRRARSKMRDAVDQGRQVAGLGGGQGESVVVPEIVEQLKQQLALKAVLLKIALNRGISEEEFEGFYGGSQAATDGSSGNGNGNKA